MKGSTTPDQLRGSAQPAGAGSRNLTVSLLARRVRLCVPLVALCMLVFAASSYGQATTGKFTVYIPRSGPTDFPCDSATGVLTGTATQSGEFVATPQGFHFHGVETMDFRIDLNDGRYLVSSTADHFDFNQTGKSPEVYTEVEQDRGTLYTATGQSIGVVSIFSLTHTTWSDSNGNGFPDAGEITGDVSVFRVTCP